MNLFVGTSHWSCGLAGSGREFTLPGYFTSWNFQKCSAIIPLEGIRRSVNTVNSLALVPEAELPMVPRSVPRKSRPSIAPSRSLFPPRSSRSPLAPTEEAPSAVAASVATLLLPSATAPIPVSTNTSSFSNDTNSSSSVFKTSDVNGTSRSLDISRLAREPLAVAVSSPPNVYAIALGVVGGALVIVLLITALFCFRLRKRKRAENVVIPSAPDAPTNTPVVVVPLLQVSATSTEPSTALCVVATPTANEDCPPPYVEEDPIEPGLRK